MNPSTLGAQMLRLQYLERPEMPESDPQWCQSLMDAAVHRFFENAKAFIQHAIAQGQLPAPISLDLFNHSSAEAAIALDISRWKLAQPEVPSDNAYVQAWEDFKQWAKAQDLDVSVEYARPTRHQHARRILRLQPTRGIQMRVEEVKEVKVVLPKAIIDQFGSAQAYIEYLRKHQQQQ